MLCIPVGGWIGGEDSFGVGVLKDCSESMVNRGEGFGAFGVVGGSSGAEKLDGVLAHSSVGFEYEWGEVAVWIALAFVLLSTFVGVVGYWRGVGGCSVFGRGVGYGYVDVGGCVVVSRDDVHDGAFELWWVAYTSVEFRYMDF